MIEGRVVTVRPAGVTVLVREGSGQATVTAVNTLNKPPRVGQLVLLERTVRGYALVGRRNSA